LAADFFTVFVAAVFWAAVFLVTFADDLDVLATMAITPGKLERKRCR
jgi:hypothetical protein